MDFIKFEHFTFWIVVCWKYVGIPPHLKLMGKVHFPGIQTIWTKKKMQPKMGTTECSLVLLLKLMNNGFYTFVYSMGVCKWW